MLSRIEPRQRHKRPPCGHIRTADAREQPVDRRKGGAQPREPLVDRNGAQLLRDGGQGIDEMQFSTVGADWSLF